MPSPRPQPLTQPRPLSLWFILLVLCLHHCCARKVLFDDLKREYAQPHENVKLASSESGQVDSNDVSIQGGIGIGCGSHGCPPPGGIPCFQEPCQPYVPIPQQPIIVPTPPYLFPPGYYVPTPPTVVPTPCTPCEPWYGPGPCPCEPCEEGAADEEGVNAQGHKSNNNAQEGEKLVSSEQIDKEKQDGAAISTSPIIPNQEGLSSGESPGKGKVDGARFIADGPTPASFTSGDGSELRF